ncbi:hypothetical protein BKA70DRAFT_1424121 [Coprinopsis sp. MPI-PUGE-AT-0042]|nr:hypothetical protein BKA70DRAFT_1424121 [Coprinopsis sp. MPI-PUGE-AT-0042]
MTMTMLLTSGSSITSRCTKCGKSIRSHLRAEEKAPESSLLLQAVQHTQSQDWITLYIPRSASLINSTTPHTYDLRT